MSKQSDAKLKQGWTAKPIKICTNCTHFSCDTETVSGFYGKYTKDKNLRCKLGGFKTGKTSACNDWCANPPNVQSSGTRGG
jgi:hypothetical protein